MFSLIGVSGAIILVQLAWFGWQARRLNAPVQLHQATSRANNTEGTRPRIIWIVLDELSYQQIYGHRYHTLSLPAFDRLASESSIFTGVAPAGIKTELVMPSLITGQPVDQIEISANGIAFKLHNPMTAGWNAFDQHNTVFSDALTAGYSTAIAGWYNPYCRILPEVLDHCFWISGQLDTDKMLPRASIASNTLYPFLLSSSVIDLLPYAITHGKRVRDISPQIHILDYRQISESADYILKDPSFDFILLHMPVPHPGGIYNRVTRTFALQKASYLDNLALADSYMAHVRGLLENEGQWDSSAIVIMGDHSWRTNTWSATTGLTVEEKEASDGGRFDDRPGYIVKLPEQKVGTTIPTRFAAVHTRRLLNAIMKKEIVSSADLSKWVTTVDREEP